MNLSFLQAIAKANNQPPDGNCIFDSSDHIRYQNGVDVSGHNYNCYRRFKIEKNISGQEGYTITLYNLDGQHPFEGNNVQMSPKRMRIISSLNNMIEFRGYGHDENAAALGAPKELTSFAHYGMVLTMHELGIEQVKLIWFHKNVSIVYFKDTSRFILKKMYGKNFIFQVQYFEEYQYGKCVATGSINTLIMANVVNDGLDKVIVFYLKNNKPNINFSFALPILGVQTDDILEDRIQYGRLPSSLSWNDSNDPLVCNIFNDMQCIRFAMLSPLRIIEFYGSFTYIDK